MKNSLLRVALVLAMLTATTTFGASQRWICRETGKELDRCCCEPKDGKFYCKLTKRTFNKCCCDKREKKS